MSQFGMQMPGGRASRGPTPDMYTVLAFFAMIFLLAACGVMWVQATRVSPAGHPFALQEKGRIQLSGTDRR